MGGQSSSPPSPLLSKPWREINWNDKQRTLQHVKAIRPKTDGQVIRILLHGLVGAGKSSFINSVDSVLQGRMCSLALVANSSSGCCTKKYVTHKFSNGNQDTFYPFVINDNMGLRNNCSRSNRNNHVRDIEQALKGHVSEGYTFNPERRISMNGPFLNLNPSANDKVQVLVFVIDANTFSQMNEKAVETLQDIRDEASELDIPQVALLTKIDEVCPEIQQDVKNIYKSKILKEKMKEVSARVGLPENCILPSSDPERTETHPPARKRPPQHVHVMLHTAHVITVRHVWERSWFPEEEQHV
ncbi:interferon-induced protein 44-like isoform X2 [Pseudochaenichthys georgianus]|uniref:interferon-induced protein 44-like isoform X2 n=1 Tax=Pseudochaenichthys georgianus TaxID=52239 RepID=UPI00146E7063|nr:interferon-induced protein 44-like isoform X2 [Pseudochaenichthys georgianus]